MSNKSDNEWAAEFLGMTEDDTPGWYQWNPTGASTEYQWIKDWRPDSDLNQFKLMLDKFREWRARRRQSKDKSNPWRQPGLERVAKAIGPIIGILHGYEQTMNHLTRCAFEDLPAALSAIRAAVEATE